MNLTLRLAWRNIWRHPRRTLLTVLAVAFAAAVLVFSIALQLSSYAASINASVSIFTGHAQIQREGYFDKPRVRSDISGVAALRSAVEGVPNVVTTALRAIGFALVSSESRTYGVQIVGVEPEQEQRVSTIPGSIAAGSYLSSNDAMEAVIGEKLAKNLKLEIGGELTVLGQGRDGSLAATVVPVVGLFRSVTDDLDRSLVQVPLRFFQETFGMQGAAHSIVLVGNDLDRVDALKATLEPVVAEHDKNGELAVLTWEQLLPGLRQAIDLDMASGWLFYLGLILIVTFSILNTFLMSVLERTREFGVMLAIGAKPGIISKLIIVECLMLTAVGLIFGVILGGLVVTYYGLYGFTVPGSEEIMKVWNLPSAIHPKLSLYSLTNGPGVILFVTILAALYPALRIFFVKPTEALQER